MKTLRFAFLITALTAAGCASDSPADNDAGADAGIDPNIDINTDVGGRDLGGIDAGTDSGPDSGPDTRPDVPIPAECGDGVLDPGEQCDDGVDNSNANSDACRENCQEAACGDSVVDSGEECDDGNLEADDLCDLTCRRPIADLCRPCSTDADCGGSCIVLDDGDFCGVECRTARECPDGFVCTDVRAVNDDTVRQCVPASGSCEECFDPDRDGYGVGSTCAEIGDCDQTSSDTYPGAPELCDTLDNDCDGKEDEELEGATYYADRDRDNAGDPDTGVEACERVSGFVSNDDDCDDDEATVHSGAPELCDALDNDCDDIVDEGAAARDFYPDGDGDGFGDDEAGAISSCEPIPGAVTNNQDCDDGNGLVSPRGVESCADGLDNDCDDEIDCADSDCDGDSACTTSSCPDDGFEENDNADSASSITAGTLSGLRSCGSDDDFFSISLAAGAELTVTATFVDADGDVDLQLQDAEGRVLIASTSVTDNEDISMTVTDSGVYYIRVLMYADAGAPGANYSLDVDVVRGDPTDCRDDGYEDNDTRATAAVVLDGTITGTVVCPGDADYFTIDLAAGDELELYATFSDAAGDVDMLLYNSDGTVVGRAVSVTDDESINYVATRSGRYIIHVYLLGDDEVPGNTYELDLDVTSAGPACDSDRFEDNDTFETAVDFEAGSYTDLIVCDDDDDFYGFDLGAGDVINIDVDFAFLDGNINIDLRNPAGDIVAESTNLVTSAESIEYSAPASGRYTLNVRLAFDLGDSAQYDLDVVIDEATPTCTDDGLEDNDTFDDARPIGGSTDALQVCEGDDDFYSVTLGAGDTLTVAADFSHAEGDIDLRLLNGDGAIVASSVSLTDDEALSHVAESAGNYVIRVSLWRDAGATSGNGYDIDIDIDEVSAPSCPTDRLENNDSMDDAEPLPPELYTRLTVCEDDEDWYRLPLTEGDTITVSVTFPHSEGDIDLRLINPDGIALRTSASSTDDEQVEYTVDATGTYYIRVYLYADDGSEIGNEYDILVEVDGDSTFGETCETDDRLEDNDDFESGAFLEPELYTRLLACPDDEDFFTLLLSAGQTVTVTLDFEDAEGDIDMFLLDESESVVASSDGVTDREEFSHTSDSLEFYRVRVMLLFDRGSIDGNEYDMLIEFD
jgi:cysteine-rich repeat protein